MKQQRELLVGISHNITEDQNRMLTRLFSREDILEALKAMNPSKAPGPNGAHMLLSLKNIGKM